MRQLLEVHGCPEDAAADIQTALRATYYKQLLPLIENICTRLSEPGRIHRIDRLEINLGEVSLDSFGSSIVGKFEAAFSSGLASAIGGAPEINANLEFFKYFICTGSVPWWANRLEDNLLATNLAELLRRTPQALRRAMQAMPEQERMQRRIARAYSDDLLDELTSVLAPSLFIADSGAGSAWLSMLLSVCTLQGHSVRSARNIWWEEVLRAFLTAENTPASEAPRFIRDILLRVARRLAQDYRVLVTELRRALDDSGMPVLPWVREITEILWQELANKSVQTRESNLTSDSESIRDALIKMLVRLEQGFTPSAEIWTDLLQLIDPLPAHMKAKVQAIFEAAKARANQSEGVSAATREILVTQLRSMLGQLAATEQEKSIASNFSDADEIYIGNAGLVILWPFLYNFFSRLGLTENKQFKDEDSVQRGVGLLQYLASGDESPPEILLPLNKVLCGMAPEAVFDFGLAITAQEKEECDGLLAAVIQQAPVLRAMSSAGFRGSFLLRQGQLSTRDGNWLLRVERETHDIVLDRFPWGVSIVKLPWMTAMMQVEW